MNGGSWLSLIVVSLVVGLVVGLIAGVAGVEMPWWGWAIVGAVIVAVTSAWSAYRQRKKDLGQTEVEEEAPKSEE